MRILLSAYPPSDWIYPAGKNAEHGKGQSSKEPGPLELARIGSLLFIFADSPNDQNGSSSSIDTFATRLSAQPLIHRRTWNTCTPEFASSWPGRYAALAHGSCVDSPPYPVCFALYATTSPAA